MFDNRYGSSFSSLIRWIVAITLVVAMLLWMSAAIAIRQSFANGGDRYCNGRNLLKKTRGNF